MNEYTEYRRALGEAMVNAYAPPQSVTARPNWTANMQKVLVRDQLGIPMAIGMVEPWTPSPEERLWEWADIWWYTWRLAAMLAWAGGCWLLAELV